MPKKTDTKVEGWVLGLSSQGLSLRSIVKTLKSRNIAISHVTVRNIIKNIGYRRQRKAAGFPSPEKVQPVKVTTVKVVRKVKRLSELENPPTQKEMAKKVGVSPSTVRRILEKLGKRVARKTGVHKLFPRHMINRKRNCRKLYETFLSRKNSEFVVTLDEAMFGIHCVNGKRKICYVQKGERVPENWFVDKDNFLKTFMVVGAISGRGTLPLLKVPKKTKFNAAYYINNVLKPLIHKYLPRLYGEDISKVLIHHDAASSHTARMTASYAAEVKCRTGVTLINNTDIPVKSPDVSPMDFFGFGYLKRRIFRRRAKTEKGLWKIMRKEWDSIDRKLVDKVFNCWKRRLRLVVDRHGQHIENVKNIHSKRHS